MYYRNRITARVFFKNSPGGLPLHASAPAEEIRALIADRIPPAIGETRRYQTLQALIHCSRRSLLPDPAVTEETRAGWAAELRALEARGVR